MSGVITAIPRSFRQVVRRFGTSQAKQAEEKVVVVNYSKLKERQKIMQVDDGVPIYLKGGAADKGLYYITSVLATIATVWALSVGFAQTKK